MLLSKDERVHLAKVFDIPKSGVSEIIDQRVITDGHNADDLMTLTAERMEIYVGSKESFPRLWELTCAKAHYELNPPVGIIKKAEIEEPELPVEHTKHGKKPKSKQE